MRTFLFLTLFIFSTVSQTFGQTSTDDLLSKVWQFKMLTSITGCDRLGTAVVPAYTEIAEHNYQFRVVNILTNGDLVIKFLYWHVSGTVVDSTGVTAFTPAALASPNALLDERFYMTGFSGNYFRNDKETYFRYFTITRIAFDNRCEEKLPGAQFTVGALTLPIKMRFGQKDGIGGNKSYTSFTGNVSVGLSFGCKQNISKRFSLNYLGGFSLSSIPVNAETTNNFVQNETNQAAVTWHLGVLASIDNFQIGVYTGIDYLSGKINKEWVYRDKPWIGIGIGFSFFNAKKTTETQ